MIILQNTDSNQTVTFIGRELYAGAGYANFTDEQSNETHQYVVTLATSADGYHTEFTRAMTDLLDDRRYRVEIGYSSTEIFRGLARITNQTVAGYSINNGIYTERETTNEYKYFGS